MLHNAGRSQRARWEHTNIQVDMDLFDLNVFSVVNLSRCIMPHFIERNSGTFALMSSAAGKAGVPYSGSYTGSKHALHVSKHFLMHALLTQGPNVSCYPEPKQCATINQSQIVNKPKLLGRFCLIVLNFGQRLVAELFACWQARAGAAGRYFPSEHFSAGLALKTE